MGMVFAYAMPDLATDSVWSGIGTLRCLGKGGLRDRIETVAVAGGARLTTFVLHDPPSADVEPATRETGFVFLHYTPGPKARTIPPTPRCHAVLST